MEVEDLGPVGQAAPGSVSDLPELSKVELARGAMFSTMSMHTQGHHIQMHTETNK